MVVVRLVVVAAGLPLSLSLSLAVLNGDEAVSRSPIAEGPLRLFSRSDPSPDLPPGDCPGGKLVHVACQRYPLRRRRADAPRVLSRGLENVEKAYP